MLGLVVSFFISFSFLMIAVTVHEFAHAFLAYRLGDNTAKYSGRLTLNPLSHIDPIWTFIIPLFLFISTGGQFIFGAAKPVPINFLALRNPKRDVIWVGASGPIANFAFAFILSLLAKTVPLPVTFKFIFENLIVINVILGVFNLIPIPPLDGSRILMGLLPWGMANKYALIEPYGFMILILLLSLGIFRLIILPIVTLILNFLGIS